MHPAYKNDDVTTSLETGLCWIGVAALAILVDTDARPAPAVETEIHPAPVENLGHIGLSLIRSATKSVSTISSASLMISVINSLPSVVAGKSDCRV